MKLLRFLENEADALGRPVARCIKDFPLWLPMLDGFFSLLASGEVPGEAYRKERGTLPLSEPMDTCLLSAFDSFGGDRMEVRRGLGDARARYEHLLDAERQAHEKRVRLFRTLTTASAMGLVIMLL